MTAQYRRIASIFALTLALAAAAPPHVAAASPTPGPAAAEAKVNINTASAEELTTLPGIGPSYAPTIVEHREKNGPFRKIEDLLSVRGIGDKTYERIKDRITVGK